MVIVVLNCVVTARKRSLRRLCFHRCLSVHRQISVRETSLITVKSGRYASYWNAFLFVICKLSAILLIVCSQLHFDKMPEVADHLAHIMEMECDECKPSKGTNTLYDMFSEDGEYNLLREDINSPNKFAYFLFHVTKKYLDGNIPLVEHKCSRNFHNINLSALFILVIWRIKNSIDYTTSVRGLYVYIQNSSKCSVVIVMIWRHLIPLIARLDTFDIQGYIYFIFTLIIVLVSSLCVLLC